MRFIGFLFTVIGLFLMYMGVTDKRFSFESGNSSSDNSGVSLADQTPVINPPTSRQPVESTTHPGETNSQVIQNALS